MVLLATLVKPKTLGNFLWRLPFFLSIREFIFLVEIGASFNAFLSKLMKLIMPHVDNLLRADGIHFFSRFQIIEARYSIDECMLTID